MQEARKDQMFQWIKKNIQGYMRENKNVRDLSPLPPKYKPALTDRGKTTYLSRLFVITCSCISCPFFLQCLALAPSQM